jgi:hypothetical protein
MLKDSDEDGYEDGVEVTYGSSPTDPDDNPGSSGIVVDGALDSEGYTLLMSQTVNTAWGDNENELNAAYTCITNGRLYLMLTGNIENNWNKLEIFFDSTDAVQTNVLDTVDWEGGQNLDGLTFDVGFEPDYHCFFRRGDGQAYFNLINLATEDDSSFDSLFAEEGSATTGIGNANNYALKIAYTNANTGGVTNGTAAAADQHWTNSLYGLELSIDLRDLGDPSGTVKIAAVINNGDRNYLSNQMLAGLPAGTDSLGGDMVGGWDGDLNGIDFTALAGDQFAGVDVGGGVVSGPFAIGSISLLSGTSFAVELVDLTVGASYKIQGTASLTNEFSDVAETEFTAASSNETVTVSSTNSVRFFKAVSP